MEAPAPSSEFVSHICAICLKQANYVCPRCGINYCSLPCYRSEKHNQCSEAFYRDCCMDSMKTRFADRTSRTRMLDILRREAGAPNPTYADANDSSGSDVGEGCQEESEPLEADMADKNSDLTDRFSDLNFNSDTVDTTLVWSRLTKQEKRDFCRMINSGGLEAYIPVWTPWWHAKKNAGIEEINQPSTAEANPTLDRLPPPLPLRKIFPSGKMPHNSVVLVLLDVLLGYAFIARLYNGDYMDLKHEAAYNFCQIVASFGGPYGSKPAQNDKPKDNSKTIILSHINSRPIPTFSSIAQVVGSIQTRLCQLQFPCSPQIMIMLLEDLLALTNTGSNICQALDDSHILVSSVRATLNAEDQTDHTASTKQLLNAHHKLAFLRSCFNLQDPIAIKWQATVFPTLHSQLSMELCKQLTSCSTEHSKSTGPAAGPNWRQMIRDNKNAPVITPIM